MKPAGQRGPPRDAGLGGTPDSENPVTMGHLVSNTVGFRAEFPKYWSDTGAQDLLQLTADHLSTSQP